jgi:hypothetical protein
VQGVAGGPVVEVPAQLERAAAVVGALAGRAAVGPGVVPVMAVVGLVLLDHVAQAAGLAADVGQERRGLALPGRLVAGVGEGRGQAPVLVPASACATEARPSVLTMAVENKVAMARRADQKALLLRWRERTADAGRGSHRAVHRLWISRRTAFGTTLISPAGDERGNASRRLSDPDGLVFARCFRVRARGGGARKGKGARRRAGGGRGRRAGPATIGADPGTAAENERDRPSQWFSLILLAKRAQTGSDTDCTSFGWAYCGTNGVSSPRVMEYSPPTVGFRILGGCGAAGLAYVPGGLGRGLPLVLRSMFPQGLTRIRGGPGPRSPEGGAGRRGFALCDRGLSTAERNRVRGLQVSGLGEVATMRPRLPGIGFFRAPGGGLFSAPPGGEK